jgi:hypothetical protein
MDNAKMKAQVSVEFALAFIVLAVFVVAAAKLFVWMGGTMVSRQKAYDASRSMNITTLRVGNTAGSSAGIPPVDFYNNTTGKKDLDIFGSDEE